VSSNQAFWTIADIGTGFYKEKGSKFFGFALPVSSEEEIKEHLTRLRSENPDACHVCYAFKLGADGQIFRASDDGEPHNSAGPPILGQINASDVTNVLVAVVRIYGGTNLGVGGLILAYKTAAKEALDNAPKIEKVPQILFNLTFSYNQMPDVLRAIKVQQIEMKHQTMELSCAMQVAVKEEQMENWIDFLQSANIDFERLTFV
jgi:uncharacterized YigZ family protein